MLAARSVLPLVFACVVSAGCGRVGFESVGEDGQLLEPTCTDNCGPNCGDGVCDGSEDTTTCTADCGSSCGDGVCNGSEDTTTCTADCGSSCGDGVCNGSEDSTTCDVDCGASYSDVDKNGVRDDNDADILFWIDASDADSLTTSTGAPTDGALVESWADRSVHRAHLVTYNTLKGQARYVASQFPGGRPGVRFVNSQMEARGVDVRPSVAPQLTSIAVVRYLPDSIDGLAGVWVGQQNGFNRRTHVGSTANTNQVSTAIFDQSASFYGHWENGVQTGNETRTCGEDGSGIGVGQWLYDAYNNPGAYNLNVMIGELIIFRGALSNARRSAVEQYLRAKWGL